MPHHVALDTITLKVGGHASAEAGLCLLEAVAYFAGEPHSDHPKCASLVLTRFGISLNDRMPDELRTKLLIPLIPSLVGTAGDLATEHARATVLARGAVTRFAPLALRARKWDDLAAQLEAIPADASLATLRDVARAVATEAHKRRAAYAASDAAAYAADAAYAAYAAAASDAAAYAADAAADAAAYAADAAYAAADAADAAYAAADAYAAAASDAAYDAAADAASDAAYERERVFTVAVEVFKEAIAVNGGAVIAGRA